MDRREFTAILGLGAAGASLPAAAADATSPAPQAPAPGATFHIGMLLFDGMTYLDLAGPQDGFTKLRNGKVHSIARSRDVITTDSGIRVLPDMSLEEAPELDLLFVGGGQGVAALMEDEAVLAFLKARAPRARWVTSVCTGALVLGAAGLLRGYKAATHWTAMEILPVLGAEPVHQRVVIDRNRITGGGVTAGIDFGLVVLQQIGGEGLAKLVQLGSEYDPSPPFDCGSPGKAPPELVQQFRTVSARATTARLEAARRAAAKFSRG